MILYSRLQVVDGDTVKIKLWPSGLWQSCRIRGLDTDEINSGTDQEKKRGRKQKQTLEHFCANRVFVPFFFRNIIGGNRRKVETDKYGRWLITVYAFRRCRYVNYAKFMVKTNQVKRGSKWNI